jgi:hypothetical protein
MASDRVLGLFKFGLQAYGEQFVSGCLYMNALRYFVEGGYLLDSGSPNM